MTADLAWTQRARAGEGRRPRTGPEAAGPVSPGHGETLWEPKRDGARAAQTPSASGSEAPAERGRAPRLSVGSEGKRLSAGACGEVGTHVTRPELSAHPAGHRVPPTAAPPPLTHEASPAVPVRPTPRRNPEGSLGASAPAPGHRALQRPCGHKPRSRPVPTGPTGHASGLVLRGRRAVLPVDTRTRHEAASGRMQGGPRQRPLPRDTCARATHHDPRGPGPGAGAGAGRRQSTAWCGQDSQPLRSAGAVPG